MKTIGVLGGLGPQATMDFEWRFHAAAQERLPQRGNSGYPPLIVIYCRFPPVLTDADLHPIFPLQPDPRLLRAAEELGALADFLVITANGPHSFSQEIEAASGLQLLNMVDLALKERARRGWRKVGLLALGKPQFYSQPLEEAGLATVVLQDELRERLDRAIFKVMKGRDGAVERAVAAEALAYLRDAGADGIILGCTELPLLLDEELEAPDLINPGQLLAEAAVDLALS